LYEEGQTRAAIALLSPWTAAGEQLAEGRSWTIGETAWSVEGSEARGDDDAWRLRLDDATGPLGNVWVAKESGLIVAGIRTVVVNRGTEYLLSWDLAGEEPVAPDSLVAVQLAMDELIRLRGRLDLAGSDLTAKPVLGARSISVLAAALPAIQQGAKVPQVAGLLRAAADDIERQERRAAGVEELRSRFEGAPVVRFSAKDSTGRELSSDDLAGHVTVLHFWDYLDEPLEEPYGQVGYLEFLHSRREAEGVKVYGVAVNSGLADEDGRSGIVSSIRRFTSFMNLTYPVLLDAGELLKEFGDPRRTGAALPLYVVIGPDGTIDLYHVGFYEVDQQVGLKELDEAVGRLVEAGQK
jgi:peroxiredoxin